MTAKALRLRVAVEQAIARGDWPDSRIADELDVTDQYVTHVRRQMDDIVWPTTPPGPQKQATS